MEHVGIGLHRVYRLAVLAEQLHEMLEGAQRCGAYLLFLALRAMVGTLVAHAQHQAAEHAYALLILAHRVLIAEQHIEEVVDGVERRHDAVALLEEKLLHGVLALDIGEYLCRCIAQQLHAGDADEPGLPVGRGIGNLQYAVGRDDEDAVGSEVIGVDIHRHACRTPRA